jgi:hypothetical protein
LATPADFDGGTILCHSKPEGHHVWCPVQVSGGEPSQTLASQVLDLFFSEGGHARRSPVFLRSFLQQALRENDVDDLLHRVQACPVALQLARERDPGDRLGAGLDHALHATSVRFD